jgi:hypothetical protein
MVEDDDESIENEVLPQHAGSEVHVLRDLISANSHDPAYVLGEFAVALGMLAGDTKHDMGEPRYLELENDLIELRKRWLTQFPELNDLRKLRWTTSIEDMPELPEGWRKAR